MRVRKIQSILLSLVMVCLMFPVESMAAPAVGNAIYVAVNGNDTSGDGSEAKPFATLERAKEEIQTEKDEHTFPAEGQTVYLREGVYHITSSFLLNEDYAHTTWSAYPGEEVTISAATELPSALFTPVSGTMKSLLPASARDHVVVLDLASAGLSAADFTRTEEHAYPGTEIPLISDNGVMADIASYPNEQYSWDWLQATGDNTAYGDTMPVDDTVAAWTYQIDQMFGYGYFSSYYSLATYGVKSIDSGNKTLTFKEIYSGHPAFEGLAYESGVGNGIKLINAYQALDAPGEWYLDRAAGKFYYYPMTTVADMHLEMTRDASEENAVICLAGASDVHIQGMNLMGAMNYGVQGAGCSDCSVTDCDISLIKDTAVLLTQTKNCEISNCKIHDTGSGGISIVDETMLTKDMSKNNNTISDNEIYAVDRNKRVYAPAIYIMSTGNTVEHNEIHDLYHEAIEFYGAFTTISYNDIYNVSTDCGDSGAIYTRYNIANIDSEISYNHIHGNGVSAGQPEKITHAIYFDDNATGDIDVKNNIFGPEACEGAAIEINGGQKINIQDNLFLDTPVIADWNNHDAESWLAGVGDMYGKEGLPLDPAYETSEYEAWYDAYPYLHDIEKQSKMNNTLSHNILLYDSESPEDPYANMWQQVEGSYYIGLDDNKVITEDISSYFDNYDDQEFQLKTDALEKIQSEWDDFNNIEFDKIGIMERGSGDSFKVEYVVTPDPDYGVPGDTSRPIDTNTYHENDQVTVVDNQTTAWTTSDGTDKGTEGTWTFTPWDHTDFRITEDTTIRGSWIFTPTPPATYSVSYEVAGDDTYGIPMDGKAPATATGITSGLNYTLAPAATTAWTTSDGTEAGVKGTWKFTGWSSNVLYADKLLQINNITEDKKVYGKWEFIPTPITPTTYKVEYVVTSDPEYGVPGDAPKPVDTNAYHKNDQVTVAKNQTTEWTTSDGTDKGTKGTWTFTPWDHTDFQITEDTTITGGWTFTPAAVATYSVSYEVTGDDTYGIPTDGTAPTTVTGITGGFNYTLAKAASTAWTTSDGTEAGVKGTWKFTGWSSDVSYADKLSQINNITENKKVYGKWEFTPTPIPPATYKVEYVVTPDPDYGVPGDAPKPVDTNAYHKNDQVTVAKNQTTEWTTSDGTDKGTEGTWTFTLWDHTDFQITEDTTIKGSWTFTPALAATYSVSYEVKGDDTYGIPTDGKAPATAIGITSGLNYRLAKSASTEWTTSDGTDAGVKGTWEFTGWSSDASYADKLLQINNITENKKVYGKWKFTPTATYTVTYKVEPDATYGLPSDVTTPVDSNSPYLTGALVTVVPNQTTTETTAVNKNTGKTEGGTWKFTTWDKEDFQITENTTITGSWTFTSTPVVATYSVSYEVKGDDTYGIPTDGTAPTTATGIRSGLNYTLAKAVSTAWTTSDGTEAGVKGTWEFTGWSSDASYADQLLQINNITENKTVYGIWEFTPTPTYTVTYEVEPDATYGLPSDVTTPVDSDSPYVSGTLVTVVPNLTTRETTAVNQNTGETEEGTWTFTPWDKADFQITENTTITGSWTFTPAPAEVTYKVEYVVTPDPDYGVPQDTSTPVDAKTYHKNDQVTVAQNLTTAWTTSDGTDKGTKGTWTFTPWDKADFQITGDTTITGSWAFTPTPVVPDESEGEPTQKPTNPDKPTTAGSSTSKKPETKTPTTSKVYKTTTVKDVKTGDDTRGGYMVAILLASAAAIVLIRRKRKMMDME